MRNFKTYSDLARAYIKLNEKAQSYAGVRVLFDNYNKVTSLKERTQDRRRGNLNEIRFFKAEESNKITDKSMLLSNNLAKNSLTLYPAQQLIDNSSTVNIVTCHTLGYYD